MAALYPRNTPVNPITHLACFAIRQACGVAVDDVVGAVAKHFEDHSEALPRAIRRANRKAWRALAVALAGDGLFSRSYLWLTASGDERAFRGQVHRLVAANPALGDAVQFRCVCLDELRLAVREGHLTDQEMPPAEVARGAADFRRFSTPHELAETAAAALARIAETLPPRFTNLATLLRQQPPLVAVAFIYFFRREATADPELQNTILLSGMQEMPTRSNVTLAALIDAVTTQMARIESTVVATRDAAEDTRNSVEKLHSLLQQALARWEAAPSAPAGVGPPFPTTTPTSSAPSAGTSAKSETEEDIKRLVATLRDARAVHEAARRTGYEGHDYAKAVRLLDCVPATLRVWELFEDLCRRRDEVEHLQSDLIGRLGQQRFLGLHVVLERLLKLQPNREDLCDLLVQHPAPRPGQLYVLQLQRGVPLHLVWIPPGRFVMGSPDNENSHMQHEKQHAVIMTRGFYLAATLVTQAQWRAVMGGNPSKFLGDDDRPVETVSWAECHDFCKKLTEIAGYTFRLPTEAQWEYACRAGTTGPFHYGIPTSADKANYDGRYKYWMSPADGVYRKETTPVRHFKPNAWGLYDMHGNVGEWCQDWMGDYPSGEVQDPLGKDAGSQRVVRGGSWRHVAADCRSARRHPANPQSREDHIGFRVCFFPE